MATKPGRKKLKSPPFEKIVHIRVPEHVALFEKAQERQGIPSLNQWIVQACIAQARLQLGITPA